VLSIFNCTAVSRGVPSWTCKDQLHYTVCESSVSSSTGRGQEREWRRGVFNCTAASSGGQRYSKMYRLKRYRYTIFEKKIG
jgi:hypothetical protein